MWQVGAKQGVRGLGKLIPWQSSRWRIQWQGEQCLWEWLHIWNIPGGPRSPDLKWKGPGAWGLVGPSLACREGAEMSWAKDTVVIVWKALSLETWSTFSVLSINWISPDFPWIKAWTRLKTVCEFRSSMFSVWCCRQSVYHNHTTWLHWTEFSTGHRMGKWPWPPGSSAQCLYSRHPLHLSGPSSPPTPSLPSSLPFILPVQPLPLGVFPYLGILARGLGGGLSWVIFLAMPRSMLDLSSPIGDQICGPCSGRVES